ncbi:ArsR/SmtB family transcription factor [Spirosoma sp.]|uniref:ArsR/SmtB family transcription factor n=1 Tax=Spirosoma sp. TaxID=1899569 RepID=UPI003B3B4EDE
MKRDVFQAIADPTRRAILVLIAVQAMTPNAIAEHFTTSRQAISKHIHVLLESELLTQHQQGREIYYHVNPDKMQQVEIWLKQFRDLVEKRFNQLDDVLAKLKTEQK